MSKDSGRNREVIKRLLETKAVDFKAIGNAVAEFGPSAALADEPWDWFCGTMRHFVILFHVASVGNPVEDLGGLAQADEMQ